MADISLREYLAKLDTLLKSGSAAEVILHCRHILQYYPKDAQAYRLLGQALVATSRWQEAGEVMRRVLSIFPDDREAHAGLSEVYRIEKRPDDAIWHLERAFEQTPNDQIILDNLRELYRKYHKTEHGKVQLTAAAVARQYIRNGLYEQAIDTLQKARVASPERLDLPLLLAQTYWDRGQRVEAAETALEVLKVLPDCLVANTLLAAMWLTESRPSDAQLYIGRIESLDPYLALELAQGQDVPDNAFKLEELDYQRAAEREIVASTPDWLEDVTENTDEVPDFFNEISVDEDVVAKKQFNRDLTSDEWANSDLSYSPDDTGPLVRKPTGPLTGLTGRLSKPPTGSLRPEAAAPSNVPGPKLGLTGRFTPVPEQIPQPEPVHSEPVDDEALPSFFDDIAAPTTEASAPDNTVYTGDLPDLASLMPDSEAAVEDLPFRRERTIEPDDNDPLAWLRSSGVEIDEAAPARANDADQYDADSDNLALQEADAADPLSWLQGYGGDNLVEQNAPVVANGTDNLPIPDDQAGDPLAWLNTTQASEPEPTAAAPAQQEDSLDWLSDDSLLDEAFNLESLVNPQTSLPEQPSAQAVGSPTAATPEWQDTMADDKDPLDWLTSEPEPEAEPSDSFTWMEDDQAAVGEPSQADFPDWLNASATSSEIVDGPEVVSENDIDWMTDIPDLTAADSEPAEEAPKLAGSGMLNWIGKETTDNPAMPAMEQPDTNAPDWLGDLQTETPSEATSTASNVDENGFEWMSTADELPPAPSTSEVPDWLGGMDISGESDAEAEAEPLAAADTPDWLTAMQPEEAKAEVQPTAQTDTSDWFSKMDMDEEPQAEAEPAASADMPDWLTAMEPEEAKAEAEPVASTDAPDWLSGMNIGDEPQAEVAATTDDTPDWLTSMNIDDEPEAEAEPLVAADAPDWLSAMRPEEAKAEAQPTSSDMPNWLSDVGSDEPETEAEPLAAADAPDWLSAMRPDDEPEAESEPLAAADTPDWLSAMRSDEPETEAEPLAAADTPDWLSAMRPADEPDAEPEPLGAADTPDWLSAIQPEDEPDVAPEPASANTPDWLSGMDIGEEPQAEPVAADTPDWLSSMGVTDEPDAEPEPLAAADTPDWLSAMQPDDELDSEPEPLGAADTPDWLSAIQPSESQAEAEPEPLAVADAPDWLAAMQPEDEPETEPEPLAAADAPDWLAALQPEDETSAEAEPELEPLAAADTPDWLAAMQPDDEPETQGVVDDTPDWLTATQHPNDVPAATSEARVPANNMSDWLNDLQNEPATDADQSMTDEEWSEAAELEPEATADVPDWLSAMNDATHTTNGQGDTRVEESQPAAPAPASNAPDWLNAMVPGLDVDYDAPEDEPVETEFLPTNKTASAKPASAKEGKTRSEFGWLLDIVKEESQPAAGVADKTALRRFVFSKQPSWLRKPTEMPDKSPAGDSDADNVDIPPWLQ